MEAKILSSSVKAVTCCALVRDKTRMLPQRVRQMALRLMQAQLCLLLALFPAASQAAPVEIQTAGQVSSTAKPHNGKADMNLGAAAEKP